MPKLINSSTEELRIKFNNATRGVVDMVLMMFGFFAGVIAAWQAATNDIAVWWGLVAFITVGLVWLVRAFLIFRISRAREKAWEAQIDEVYAEHKEADDA